MNASGLDDTLARFRRFLADSWPTMLDCANAAGWDDDPYFLARWKQANWELLVEQQILEPGQYLPPYGIMKEDPNLRQTGVGARATHRLLCIDRQAADNRGHRFVSFVTLREGSVWIDAPFDQVSLAVPDRRLPIQLPLARVCFRLEEISGA